jgi:hypothetical protein
MFPGQPPPPNQIILSAKKYDLKYGALGLTRGAMYCHSCQNQSDTLSPLDGMAKVSQVGEGADVFFISIFSPWFCSQNLSFPLGNPLLSNFPKKQNSSPTPGLGMGI